MPLNGVEQNDFRHFCDECQTDIENGDADELYQHEIRGTIEFSNLGRAKVSKTVEIYGDADMWDAVKPHLMSNDIDWTFDTEKNEGKIYVGGFREVGQFKRIGNLT